MLLNAGVDVNHKNMLGMNALLLVAGYGNDMLVKLVLEAGADPNASNDFGHSALHLAVVGKRSQVCIIHLISGKRTACHSL
jgi:ankyrin repeat protein